MSEYSQFSLDKLQALSEQIRKDLNCYRVSILCYETSFCINIKKAFNFSSLDVLQQISKQVIEYFSIKDPVISINSKREILVVQSDRIEIEIETYE